MSAPIPSPPPAWPAPWLRLWAAAMIVAIPVVLAGLVLFLPWQEPAAAEGLPLRPLLAALATVGGLFLARRYARAVHRGPRPAIWATFLWAALFTWAGVAQAGPALPSPGPTLAALWITAWVAAMAVQAWRL